MFKVVALLSLIFVFSCAQKKTKFLGEARMSPAKCEAKCVGWDMELQGMVAMGEYSDACVCKKKKTVVEAPKSPEDPKVIEPLDSDEMDDVDDTDDEEDEDDTTGVGLDPVGVILQMKDQDQEIANRNFHAATVPAF